MFTSWSIIDLENSVWFSSCNPKHILKLSSSESGSGWSSAPHVMVLLSILMQSLVFEGVVIKEPWRIFGPNKQERTREERKFCIWELYNLYSSPIMINEIKWRKLRLMRHTACVGRWNMPTELGSDHPKKRYHFGG